jgi:hypothetical protein
MKFVSSSVCRESERERERERTIEREMLMMMMANNIFYLWTIWIDIYYFNLFSRLLKFRSKRVSEWEKERERERELCEWVKMKKWNEKWAMREWVSVSESERLLCTKIFFVVKSFVSVSVCLGLCMRVWEAKCAEARLVSAYIQGQKYFLFSYFVLSFSFSLSLVRKFYIN